MHHRERERIYRRKAAFCQPYSLRCSPPLVFSFLDRLRAQACIGLYQQLASYILLVDSPLSCKAFLHIFAYHIPTMLHLCLCLRNFYTIYIWRAADKAQYTFNLGRHEGQDRSNVLLKFLDSDTEKLGLVLRNLANGKSLDCAPLS